MRILIFCEISHIFSRFSRFLMLDEEYGFFLCLNEYLIPDSLFELRLPCGFESHHKKIREAAGQIASSRWPA